MIEVGDSYLQRWQEIEYDPRVAELMVFTACRLWCLHEQGLHVSKSEAASLVHRRAPYLNAPLHALELVSAQRSDPLTKDEVMKTLGAVRTILARPLAADLPTDA
jgi:hypothetical protein